MTREFSVGMVGKTTKGYPYLVGEGPDGDGDVLACCLGSTRYFDAKTGANLSRYHEDGDHPGDLVHPDDAKEEIAQEALASVKSDHIREAEFQCVPIAQTSIDPLRFQAACAALTGILAGGFADTIPYNEPDGADDTAEIAVRYADAILARLSEKEG